MVGGPNKGMCFEQADVSFVMRRGESESKDTVVDRVTGYQLLFPPDAPLGLVVSTLRLGRRLQNNVRQCLLMSIMGSTSLSFVLMSIEWIELEIVLSLVRGVRASKWPHLSRECQLYHSYHFIRITHHLYHQKIS